MATFQRALQYSPNNHAVLNNYAYLCVECLKDAQRAIEPARLAVQIQPTRAEYLDGTWVLHPGQIAAANEIYAIGLLDYERAVDIADAMAIAARDERKGAVMFGSEMIDEATRKLTEVAIAQGRRAGLTVRPTPADVPPHARAAWRAANDPGPAAG